MNDSVGVLEDFLRSFSEKSQDHMELEFENLNIGSQIDEEKPVAKAKYIDQLVGFLDILVRCWK